MYFCVLFSTNNSMPAMFLAHFILIWSPWVNKQDYPLFNHTCTLIQKSKINDPPSRCVVIYLGVVDLVLRVFGNILYFVGNFSFSINQGRSIFWNMGLSKNLLATHRPYTRFFQFSCYQFFPIRFCLSMNLKIIFHTLF